MKAAAIAREDWPRLLALVEEAMDVPAPARPAWLSALELPSAQQDALRGLLQDRRAIESDDFLGLLPELAGSRPAAEPPVARLAPGRALGPWRLVREIGEGGMSTVWLAQRADGQVSRQVALKLPHAGPGQDVLGRRLLRERDILAALEHRHIGRLYDVGVTEDGVPYLVMEYIDGRTFAEHADAHRLTVRQRLALFRQVLQAVQYAHGKLVLHRDLKPQNILVTDAGEVKLLDFGIAKLLSSAQGTRGATELTQIAGRRLTPAYASPEQLRGEALGTASDVYALGVVLYELLCGRRPFEGAESSPGQLEQAVLRLEPRPLGRQEIDRERAEARGSAPGALRAVLSGDLNAIVLKALAREPERRYPSAQAMEADVANWLEGRPVAAHPPGKLYYAAKFLGRHRLGVTVGTVVALALATSTGIALEQARVAREEAVRAATARDFLLKMFDESDPDKHGSRELTAKGLLEHGSVRATEQLAQSPAMMAQLLQYIGNAQANLADHVGADRTFALAVDAYRRSGDVRGQVLAVADRFDNTIALGQFDAARTLIDEAATLAKPFSGDFSIMGRLLRERAYLDGFRHEWADERDALERYLRMAARDGHAPPVDRVQALQNLATALSRSGDLPGATARIDQALALLREHPELPVEFRMNVVNYRQDIQYQWGRYAEMARTSPADIRECDQQLSPQSAICLKLENRLQRADRRLGRYDEAAARGPALAPLLDQASPRDRLQALAEQLCVLARTGRLDARSDMLDALRHELSSDAAATMDITYRLSAIDDLAEALLLLNRADEARDWLTQAARLLRTSREHGGFDARRTKALEGMARFEQGRADEALAAMAPLCDPGAEPASAQTEVIDRLLRLDCVAPLAALGRAPEAIALLQANLPVLRANLDDSSPTVVMALRWLDALRARGRLPEGGAIPPV